MQTEELIQLIGSGNTSTVEDEWMRLVESEDLTPSRLLQYQPVLAQLCKVGNDSIAEALAWAAIETTSLRWSPSDTLNVAAAMLLSVPNSTELRAQVTELYRSTHADREGFEALLSEAGLEGGRPVRRAIRTLQVCLAVVEGGFLTARDDGGAARVDAIDLDTWEYTIHTNSGEETLGAVHLADRYEVAEATDFPVLRHFDPSGLRQRLSKDPAAIVVEICRKQEDSIDSDTLFNLLVPSMFTEADWKKWWTRARTALKKCPNIRLEGRAPYKIHYTDAPVAHAELMLAEFGRVRDPATRYGVVQKYIQACPSHGEEPDKEILQECHDKLNTQARKLVEANSAKAALTCTMAWAVGEAAGVTDAGRDTVSLFQETSDVVALFGPIQHEELIELACTALVEARPDNWRALLIELLPTFPQASCDKTAVRLMENGCSAADLTEVVQRIIASPVAHFEALLWLWNGPSNADVVSDVARVTLLSRVLRALHDARRSDSITKEKTKAIAARGKSALSARGYQNFDQCLEGIDGGLALALRTQVSQLENLGRVVREDLLTKLQPHFPKTDSEPPTPPWSREEVLFVTEEGMVRKTKEIDELINVKMRENAKAIGLAAEKGDLSENSEYKFALEERDLLRARLAQMNSEFEVAEVIAPATVPTDHAGIGTRVVFKRVDDGDQYEMTFVGPWDADLDQGMYNYKAPLAQAVLGKQINDIVEFNHSGAAGSYKIVELHNALDYSSDNRGAE